MKVIDLLNKIANGEEVPKKILYKYQNKDFYEEYLLKWNKKYEAYYTTKDNTPITHLLADNLWNLNDEIEIIEDTLNKDKKIEKLDLQYNDTIKGLKFEEQILMYCDNLQYKINELVEKVNGDTDE